MTVLYVLLGIVLLLVLLLSFHLGVTVDYGETTVVTLKYLFLNIPIIDTGKPKKDKKPKKEKNKDKPKPEKNGGLFKQIYNDQGYDGLVKILGNVCRSLNGFFGKLYKTFTIDELYINMITAGADAADTAVRFGKLSGWLFPTLGKLVSTCKVKKYDFDIKPDFLAKKSEGSAYVRFHVTPIKVTNAVVVLVFQLLFKVVFKLLSSITKSPKPNSKQNTKVTNSNDKGAKPQSNEVNKINNNKLSKDGASI